MVEISEINQKFLLALFESTGGDPAAQVSMHDIGASIGLENPEAGRMAEELMGFGLVEVRTLSGGIGISAEGVETVKRSGGASGADESAAYRLGSEMVIPDQGIREVETLTARLKSHTGQIGLAFDPLAELVADLRTIDAQLASTRPKTSIIRECFRSIADTLEATNAGEELPGIRHLIGEK